ncbi:hypothetical protein Vretimale_8927 [Volvox reticuliferus]|uniref:Ubiquitin carboxyl-terminal hydrolase n=1 Tax=Volvox reticuliferus TaxID=1737510 RepID=A0A8J4FRG9_9CHLO|nr:hypothetical protein Vretifemale_14394 [Volvox reticuliferus]GIM04343.1 hypothetical protein Vretimale_8927 [Volvox reticuliferus]
MHGGSGQTRTGSNGTFQPSVLSLPARWKGNQTAGAGLNNLGNTCYLNSTLQCLAYVPPLAHLCLGHTHSSSCCRTPAALSSTRLDGGGLGASALTPCTFCIIERQLAALLRGSRSAAVSPSEVLRHLQLFSRSFVRGRQEDSHELLTAVLDVMERDGRRAAVALGAPKACRTIVEDLFLGRWQSQVRCLVCGHESNTYESFTTLPLDIGQARSVAEALRAFTEAERLDGKNKYRCDKCRTLVPALKQTTIWDDPNVLVLQLKRFNGGSLLGKITRHVAFTDIVDMRPFMTPPAAGHNAEQQQQQQQQQTAATGKEHDHHHHHHQGQDVRVIGRGNDMLDGVPKRSQHYSLELDKAAGSDGGVHSLYTLTGVLVHQGTSLHSGHYYALVRDSYGDWSCMNDSHVYGTSLEQVRQEQAYLLFYTRQDMKLPRPAPVPPHAMAAMDPELIPWAATGNTPAAAAASTAGPARQVHGPQLPANMVRGSVANGSAALGEATLPLRSSRLNPIAMPSARLAAKVVISPKSAPIVAANAGTASTAESAPAVKLMANRRAVSRDASCRPDKAIDPTKRDAASAGPVPATRGSGGSVGTTPAGADTLAAGKRSRQSGGGDNDEAVRAATVSAAGGGNAASGIPSAGLQVDAAGIHVRVQQELEGLKACAFFKKGIKRVKQSLEEQLRASSLREAMREVVIHMMREEGMSLQEVLAVQDGDPRRRVLRRAVPSGILQYGMDELLKLHKSLLTPAGLPGGPLS